MSEGLLVEPGRPWAWEGFFSADPRSWILDSAEPAAKWSLLTGVLDEPDDDGKVVAAHQRVLTDPGTRDLIDRLPDWEGGAPLSGHESPKFAPNLLNLLADMGLRAGDSRKVDRVLEQMLAHQDTVGHFQSYAPPRGSDAPMWGALLCDSHAVIEVLVRYGHGRDASVLAGLARMTDDLTETAQGPAWLCLPDPATGFRGPGRKGDFCPQVTREALRVYALLAETERHSGLLDSGLLDVSLLDVARVSLAAWQRRDAQKPYMFGHGKTFKTVKWPPTWYRVYAVLDTLGRYPGLWRGQDARPEDRRSMAELIAVLIAYNMTDDGLVVPLSTSRGFEAFSFGQKKQPSAFATAQVLTVLHRLDDLAVEAQAIDVTSLSSSKGGAGVALPPSPVRHKAS
ncbi:MAG: hypothetical protein HHJ11_12565 [Phycicoccus sp.]|nr:hypothetical protein [Phycicoccus sp.]NMM35093.1 hypothetical protein [Phycicoccus sp.]